MQTGLRSTAAALLLLASVFCQTGLAMQPAGDENSLGWLGRQDSTSDGEFKVVVFLESGQLQNDVQRVGVTRTLSRGQRINAISKKLRTFQSQYMIGAADYLNRNSSTPVKRLWIVPAFTATLDSQEVEIISAMSGVERVVPDVQLERIDPIDVEAAPSLSATVTTGIKLLNVPELWRRGFTGAGRLVCSFDTGVEGTHPALAGKWRGNKTSLATAWLNTIKPNDPPWDVSGHGTHTMGLMVGSEGSDTVGVAPGAEWIAAGVIDQGKTLSNTISDILLAFQWALNPDGDPTTTDDVPDVILNSWGVPSGMFGPCDATFWAAIDNVEAAGIVTIFSAGNEGPDAQTIRNPASRASSPLNSFAVGAVDDSKIIAPFSSRGPSVCGSTSIKPEVVAPGVYTLSSSKGGGYGYMSGTSMAAPYIAGLVALCRQYNPDATTDEIKWALISSAEDLGPIGEDNAYGYGLVDASRILDYLTAPGIPNFFISQHVITEDGVGSPNETFEMQVVLVNPVGNTVEVTGRLVSNQSAGVTIPIDSVGFYFGQGGTTAINSQPFEIVFDSTLFHGQVVSFTLFVEDGDGQIFDSLDLSMTVGYPLTGSLATHDAGRIELTISDIGQYGLSSGSIYNVNGQGFRYDGSDNLLYEAGIILGRSQLQLSSSIRDAAGNYRPSDFLPSESFIEGWLDGDLGNHVSTRMTDIQAEIVIPVTVDQETIDYSRSGDDGMVIFKYGLINSSLERVTNLHFGFFADFDLLGETDGVNLDAAVGLLYQQSSSGPMVGLMALENISFFRSIINGPVKSGFSDAERLALITSGTSVESGQAGDMMFVAGGGAFDLEPGDSRTVAFALVAGNDLTELYTHAYAALNRYNSPTDVVDEWGHLPDGFELNQNYPNPFNPATTIDFTLPNAQNVNLVVYNLLGQAVKILQAGRMSAGSHSVQWYATDEMGRSVASGVYFYRLLVDGEALTRKMLLLR